jgi:hypothetical protein
MNKTIKKIKLKKEKKKKKMPLTTLGFPQVGNQRHLVIVT